VIRVHFTAGDLLRIRFAVAPAPLVELGLALATLQRRDVIFDGWRRRATATLPRAARPLLQLAPPAGTGPMFLDPLSDGIDDGLDEVMSSSSALVRRELRRICSAGQPITPWIRGLDERDGSAWQVLREAVPAAHLALVEPSWSRVLRSFRGEVAWRGRLIAEQGLQAALASLHPSLHWQNTTLEVNVLKTASVRLNGKGLTLLPSAFWTGRPLFGVHTDGSALMVYSALSPVPLVDDDGGADPLGELLGRTRAAVLALAVAQRSTGELARELGVSAASVSVHARTLRGAGLLVSERSGKSVRHSVTPLGDRLLASAAG
jgi:DNA-binding transcriptional ArsR family regulator